MKLGMIGLGRMGANIARRLVKHGHEMVVYDHDDKVVQTLVGEGMTAATSLQDMHDKLDDPKIFWVMLPAGDPT